jgi:hypothetical protein
MDSGCHWLGLRGLAGCKDLLPGAAIEVRAFHAAKGHFGVGDEGTGLEESNGKSSWESGC